MDTEHEEETDTVKIDDISVQSGEISGGQLIVNIQPGQNFNGQSIVVVNAGIQNDGRTVTDWGSANNGSEYDGEQANNECQSLTQDPASISEMLKSAIVPQAATPANGTDQSVSIKEVIPTGSNELKENGGLTMSETRFDEITGAVLTSGRMNKIRAVLSKEIGESKTNGLFELLSSALAANITKKYQDIIIRKYEAVQQLKIIERNEQELKKSKRALNKIVIEPVIDPLNMEPPIENVSNQVANKVKRSVSRPRKVIDPSIIIIKRPVGRPKKERDPNEKKRGRGRPRIEKPPKIPKKRGRPSFATIREKNSMMQLPNVSSGAHDNLVKLNPLNPSAQRSEAGIPFEIEKPRKNKADSKEWSKEDANQIRKQLNVWIITVEELCKAKPVKRSLALNHTSIPINTESVPQTSMESSDVSAQFKEMQHELEISLFGGILSDSEDSDME